MYGKECNIYLEKIILYSILYTAYESFREKKKEHNIKHKVSIFSCILRRRLRNLSFFLNHEQYLTNKKNKKITIHYVKLSKTGISSQKY